MKNAHEMAKLNPFAIASKRAALALEQKNKKAKDDGVGGGVKRKKADDSKGAAKK